MNDADAWRRFASVPTVTLATVAPSGAPRLVPVTFAVVEGPRVITAVDHKPKSTRRLARLSDIERDPRVTLLADRYDDDWSGLWWVRVGGSALVSSEPPPGAAALTERYRQYRAHPPEGPWITVTPTSVTGWGITE